MILYLQTKHWTLSFFSLQVVLNCIPKKKQGIQNNWLILKTHFVVTPENWYTKEWKWSDTKVAKQNKWTRQMVTTLVMLILNFNEDLASVAIFKFVYLHKCYSM